MTTDPTEPTDPTDGLTHATDGLTHPTDDFDDPGADRARLGRLVELDGRPALRFERRYAQPVERVWRAVTEPDELARWFPSEVVGERAVGAPLRFDDAARRAAAREAGEPTRADGPELRGTVVVVDPPNVFSFTWGPELLRFELSPDGDGTRLVFTQVLSHRSVAARNGAGWHVCLGGLDLRLGAPADDDGFAVYADYVGRVGPEPGVPGPDGSMTWERGTHVAPAQVRAAIDDLTAWGADGRRDDPLEWDVTDDGPVTLIRLTHRAIGDDAELAATWHALLLQLDMHLAAGRLLPADPAAFRDDYRRLLGT